MGEFGAALVAVGLDDLRQLLLDQAEHPRLVAEDRPQLADPLDQVGVLGADFVGLERGEALQAHVEDRLRLLARELELRDQAVAGFVGVGRAADQFDHRVEVVERDQQPLEDVGAGLGAAQFVLGAAGDDLALVVDVVVDHLEQAEGARHVVDQRHHVDAEAGLHRGFLVEVVEHDFGRLAAALQLDHQSHPGAVGLVAQVGDPSSFLSRTGSAIFVIRPFSPPFLTMNGSSVTTIASLPPLSGSTWARARTLTVPRPES